MANFHDTIMALTPDIFLEMDETSGSTAFDSSGNGYDFVINASVTKGNPPLIIGQGGTSFTFGGQSNPGLTRSGTHTTEYKSFVAVVDAEYHASGDTNNILFLRATPSLSSYFVINVIEGNTNNTFALSIREFAPGVNDTHITNYIAGNGTRQTVGFVYDSGRADNQLRFFLEGNLIHSVTTGTNPFTRGSGATSISICDSTNYSVYNFLGDADGFAAFTGILTDENMADIHAAALGYERVTDAITLIETLETKKIYNFYDVLVLTEAYNHVGTLNQSFTDTVILKDFVPQYVYLLITELILFAERNGFAQFETAADAMKYGEFIDINTFTEILQEALKLSENLKIATLTILTDAIKLVESLTLDQVLAIREVMVLSETFSNKASITESLQELIKLLEKAEAPVIEVISDGCLLAETWSSLAKAVASLTDGVDLTDTLSSLSQQYSQITDTIKLIETVIGFFSQTSSDAITLTETLSTLHDAQQSLLEAFVLSETHSNALLMFSVVKDVVLGGDSPSTKADLFSLLSDGFLIKEGSDGGGTYLGYVMNTENFAVTNWRDFNFNSLCAFNGSVLMANDVGLYRMGGTKDDGAWVNAQIETAALNFGTNDLKTIHKMYLGVSADGDVVLRVRVGGKEMVDYKVDTNSDLFTRRVKIGKGLRGRFWQFELITQDSDKFDLDSMEFHPIQVKRKI